MMDTILSKFEQMDEQKAKQLMDQVDDAKIYQGMVKMREMYVVPHLTDIRQNVQSYPDSQEVRETYRNASETQQQNIYDDAIQDLLETADMVAGMHPQGFMQLKSMLRDPTTLEALLLVFENDHIDPSYRDQLKDHVAQRLHWMGVLLMPEMYEPAEVSRIMEAFGQDISGADRR